MYLCKWSLADYWIQTKFALLWTAQKIYTNPATHRENIAILQEEIFERSRKDNEAKWYRGFLKPQRCCAQIECRVSPRMVKIYLHFRFFVGLFVFSVAAGDRLRWPSSRNQCKRRNDVVVFGNGCCFMRRVGVVGCRKWVDSSLSSMTMCWRSI